MCLFVFFDIFFLFFFLFFLWVFFLRGGVYFCTRNTWLTCMFDWAKPIKVIVIILFWICVHLWYMYDCVFKRALSHLWIKWSIYMLWKYCTCVKKLWYAQGHIIHIVRNYDITVPHIFFLYLFIRFINCKLHFSGPL